MIKKFMKYRSNKVLILIIFVVALSFISGILFPAFLSKNDISLISDTLNNFFIGIENNNLNYKDAFFASFIMNNLVILSVWILGISIVGFIFIIVLISISSFILGFSFSSILVVYGFKGILLSLAYIIPNILNLFVLIILSYYAINFSFMLYLYLFKKHEYNRRLILRRYIKILIFSLVMVFLSSIIEVFIIPNILRILI